MFKEQRVICPNCLAAVKRKRFCDGCGASLADAQPAPVSAVRPERRALGDDGLTMLVGVCSKTLSTVGGDGYSEIVLYQDESTGRYWLHTYERCAGMTEEAHASYEATGQLAQAVLGYISEHDLASWKDNRGIGLCGGDRVIRFRHGDGQVRLDSSKMPDNLQAYAEISGMLYDAATQEARRYAE